MQKITLLISLMLFQTSLFGITPDKTKTVSPNPKNITNCINPLKDKELVSLMGGFEKFQDKLLYSDLSTNKNHLSNKVSILKYPHSLFPKADESLKKDKEFVLKLLKESPRSLEFVDKSLLKDREVILTAVSQLGWLLEYASKDLKADRELVKIALRQYGSLTDADFSLRDDPEIIKIAKDNTLRAPYGNNDLRYADNRFKDDRDIVLLAVTESGKQLQYAGKKSRNNKEIVLAAVTTDGLSLEYASPRLKDDKEIVLAAVTSDGWSLEFASPQLRGDKAIVLAALENSRGSPIRFANKKLKKDKEIALKVLTFGRDLEYLDDSIKNDKQFVLKAVSNNGSALEFVAPTLQDDRDVVLDAIKSSSNSFQYVSDRLKKDKDIVRVALKRYADSNFKLVDKSLRRDKDIILFAIKHGLSAESIKLYIDTDLQKDQDIFLAIIKKDTAAIQFASDSLKKNKSYVLGLINRYVNVGWWISPPPILKYIDDSLKNDRDIVLASVKQDAEDHSNQIFNLHSGPEGASSGDWLQKSIIEYANPRFRKDKEIILAGNPGAFEFANETLKRDKKFVLSIVKQYGGGIEYASKELQSDIEVIKAALPSYYRAFNFYVPCEEL